MAKKVDRSKWVRVDATIHPETSQLLDEIADCTFTSRSALIALILGTVLEKPDRVPQLIDYLSANLPPGRVPERWERPEGFEKPEDENENEFSQDR